MTGKNSKRVQGEPPIDLKKHGGHDREKEEIVDHGDDAGGEEIVESIDVRGDASDQAADGVAVEVRSSATAGGARKFRCACRTWFAGRRAA